MVPPEPTAGVVHAGLIAGPLFCTKDTNVIVPGSVSVNVRSVAVSGPSLEKVIEYTTSLPGAADAGPFFETPASLCEGNGTWVVAANESFSGSGSIEHDTFATLVKKVPGGDAGSVWKTIVNVAEVPD